MEYQCFHLSPSRKLAHENDAPVLFESDNLSEACTYVYTRWLEEQRDIAVWQPRSQGYREIYRHKARDDKGRFVTR